MGILGGRRFPSQTPQKTDPFGRSGPRLKFAGGTFWGCFCGCGCFFLCKDSMLKVENHGDKNLCPNQFQTPRMQNLNSTLLHDLLSPTKIPKVPLSRLVVLDYPTPNHSNHATLPTPQLTAPRGSWCYKRTRVFFYVCCELSFLNVF